MGFFSWFSADVDTGKVVAKTDVREDGTVGRFEYTKPDDPNGGHGHLEYDSMEDFIKDNPSYERDKNSEKSSRKPWRGNGMLLGELGKLSFEDLQILEATTDNEYIKRSARVMLERKNSSDFDFSRRLRRR